LGNSWLVNDYKVVPNANEEILALKNLNASKTVLLREEYVDELELSYTKGPSDYIRLESYLPNELKYSYQSSAKAFAVFSEVYYDNGWEAFVNGKKVPHYRVNYILRGMELPAGSGEIKFVFDPVSYELGVITTWIASALLLIFMGVIAYRELKKVNQ
jgi:uncharacterized membrane protein YfhO